MGKTLLLVIPFIALSFLCGCNGNSNDGPLLKDVIRNDFYNEVYLIKCKNNNIDPLPIDNKQFNISEVRANYNDTFVIRFSLFDDDGEKITTKYGGYEWNDYTGFNHFYVWKNSRIWSVDYAYQYKMLSDEYFLFNQEIQKMIDDTIEKNT